MTATAAEQKSLLAPLLNRRLSSVMVVSDETVFSLYGQDLFEQLAPLGVAVDYHLLKRGESGKSFEELCALWSNMSQKGMDRASCIVALGGGQVTDIAGFAAATYMRGIDLINVPTTLLGMVDAAIGGKNGVNVDGVKNLVGTFHQPQGVVIDLEYLKSLPKRQYLAGLAEVIKTAEACSAELFSCLEPDVLLDIEQIGPIVNSCRKIKENVVAADEKDRGARAVLNFGHTFAHALESEGRWQLLHGEAVSIGISCAWHLSVVLGLADERWIDSHDTLCQQVGLPTKLPEVDIESLCGWMLKDKKSVKQSFSMVVARDVGDAFKMDGIPKEAIVEALKRKGAS